MNQSQPNPFFNPSFTFLPQSQNPDPNFYYPFPPNPQPPNPKPPPPPPNSPPTLDLLTTLSNLKHFISLAETTVNSVSSLLHPQNLPSSDDNFIPCPFDSHHRMPPESLFRHSLRCPSSPGIINVDILDTLHYPHSLKSEEELRKENGFVESLEQSNADLCFSIDGYGDLGLNFFYKDCPGVYCSTELDTSKRTFTLPGVLSVHCANFECSDIKESKDCTEKCLGLLPSDLLSVRSEVESWNGFPQLYSLLVLRVMLGLHLIKVSDMLNWVICNSPRYGVIIDGPMRDHIYVLLKLCLKAITLEASRSNELVMNGDINKKNGGLNFGSCSFSCPVLVEALTWLSSQLSVLYGEPHGRFFSINMFKRCVLNVASSLASFPSEKKNTDFSYSIEGSEKKDSSVGAIGADGPRDLKLTGNVKVEDPTEEYEREKSSSAASTCNDLVFVSQIAAAIAALHERSLLEDNIKSIRATGSLSKSQRLAEHSRVTMMAEEERKKRVNFRPILEHDGLLWHRSRNQDSNKNKTREELLAEERDYKRRRMSYRGKKVKRSITEVMHDIIEVHMDEINQAGGIGCFVKGSTESGLLPPGSVAVSDMNADKEFKRDLYNSPEPSGDKPDSYRTQIHVQQSRASHRNHAYLEDREKNGRHEKRDRDYRSKSPEKYTSRGRSHEKHRHREEHDQMGKAKSEYDKYESVSQSRTKYRVSRSFSSVSNSSADISDRKHDKMPEHRDQYRRRTSSSRRSESVTRTIFDDRYDPSESDSSRYEQGCDNEITGSKYVRRDKRHSLKNDKYRDETQRIDDAEKGHYHNRHNRS